MKVALEPRIYVACLSAYTNGVHHGEWIELDGKDASELRAEIATMLRGSPYPSVTLECPECHGTGDGGLQASCVSDARRPCPMCGGAGVVESSEEWAVLDSQDLPGCLAGQEHPDLDRLVEWADALAALDAIEQEPFLAYAATDDFGIPSVDSFREAYCGWFDNWRDFAQEHADSSGLLDGMPAHLAPYFDYEAYANDIRLSGDAFEVDGHFFYTL